MFKSLFSVFDQYRGLSRSIYVIFFARIVTNMGAFIWPMISFIMSNKMDMTPATIGLVTAIVGIIMIPATYLGGKLADRFNKKLIIIIFDTISVLLFVSCAFLEPSYLMLVLFAAAGTFATMEWPAFDALFMEASKPNEREKVYSLNYLGMNLGLVFGASMGGFLFENYMNLAFFLDGLTTITSTLLIVIFVKSIKVEDMEEEEKNEYETSEVDTMSTLEVLKKRKSVLVMIFIFGVSAFMYEQWGFSLTLYLEHIFGADGAFLYGVLMSFNAFIVIAFTPVLTKVLERLKELPKVMIGVGLFSLSFLIIINEPARYIFFIMIFVFTLGEIINTIGASPFVSRRIPASHRGRVSSYMGIGHGIGGLGGRVIAGFVIDALGYNTMFVIIAVLGLVTVGVVGKNYQVDQKLFPKLYGK